MRDHIAASVIIPAYNAEAFVADAIRSAQRQTEKWIEILVVDDGSTDATAEIVTAMAEDDHRVRLLRQPVNRGPSAARNRALDAAAGRWIVLLDADDTMEPVRVERLIALGEVHGADFVADNLMRQALDTKLPLGLFFPADMLALGRPMAMAEYMAHERLGQDRPPIGFIQPVMRRAFLERHGIRYPETIGCGEDSFFVGVGLAHGAVLWTTGEAYYRYSVRTNSLSMTHNPEVLAGLERQTRQLIEAVGGLADPVSLRLMRERADGLGRLCAYRRFTHALKTRRYGKAALLAIGSVSPPDMIRHLSATIMRRLAGPAGQADSRAAV
ncbi:glycosyltransferase family 2 protein [Marinivivus vitaminiproducens]|uniref:glycosyltransferase family 2 protein n=1 Tax=Marinivivus vitaminiproducens TaxID=3035935 RepID=UPI0027AB3C76|nr:glycosyltransferase [Geminicoccaceae bacterium SCSIO 64248]